MVMVVKKIGNNIFILEDDETQVVSIKMRKSFVEKLDAICALLKMSRSEFIRKAVEKEYKRVLEEKNLNVD